MVPPKLCKECYTLASADRAPEPAETTLPCLPPPVPASTLTGPSALGPCTPLRTLGCGVRGIAALVRPAAAASAPHASRTCGVAAAAGGGSACGGLACGADGACSSPPAALTVSTPSSVESSTLQKVLPAPAGRGAGLHSSAVRSMVSFMPAGCWTRTASSPWSGLSFQRLMYSTSTRPSAGCCIVS